MENIQALIEATRTMAQPLQPDDSSGYDRLFEAIGDARIVLIGDGSHGTDEFYEERARITRRLIEDRGFSFVGIEGDWPEVYRVNEYALGGPGTPDTVRDVFTVIPTWMWGNVVVKDFIEWLRQHNAALPEARRSGFWGLDLFSLYPAARMAVSCLERLDEPAARDVERLLSCFEQYEGKDAFLARETMTDDCERAAARVLKGLQTRSDLADQDRDTYFCAVQSAASLAAGAAYARAGARGDDTAWNIRDIQMADTLDALLAHPGPTSKAVVWAHDAHVCDYRATSHAEKGTVSVGQLVRERHPGESFIIGFGTYEGEVTASSAWGEPARPLPLRSAREDSYDAVFHEVGMERFLLLLRGAEEDSPLNKMRDLRAISAVYQPGKVGEDYEPTRLAGAYDAFVHIDRTTALQPLET